MSNSDSTPRRKVLSKRLRFEILERDGFTCRYCGAKPQDGALHVDHIIPVAEGGKTEADNLITSCEPCNSGKGQRVIGDVQPLPDFTKPTADAKAITAEITKWRKAHKKRDDTVSTAAKQMRDEHHISIATETLDRAIQEYGIAEVDYAVDATSRRVDASDYKAQTSYMYAVLRNRREQRAEPAPMPTIVKPANLTRGGCPFGSGQECPSGMHTCATIVDDDIDTYCCYLVDGLKDKSDIELDLLFPVNDFIRAWREDPRAAILDLIRTVQKLDMDVEFLLYKVKP